MGPPWDPMGPPLGSHGTAGTPGTPVGRSELRRAGRSGALLWNPTMPFEMLGGEQIGSRGAPDKRSLHVPNHAVNFSLNFFCLIS